MGATKTDHFTEKQNAISAMAKALGHPARVAILEYLMKTEGCICSDIVNELPLAQPTVSQHLKELKTAGWIKGNIEGNTQQITSLLFGYGIETRKEEKQLLLKTKTLKYETIRI